MQMFRGFSARIMEAVNHLGIEGLTLPTIPEDDGSILHFFSQLAEKLAKASAKVSELIDAECRELLGLPGTRIFSNIQRLSPDLDLEEVLQRRAPPPPGTPDRAAQARAEHLDIPSSAFRPSMPAPEHPLPQARRDPPAATPQALGSPAAKEPRKPATTERRSPAERRPRVPGKAPAMTRTPRRTPSKLSPRPPPEETVLAAHFMIVRHCPAGPFFKL
jgi:hypothetical protein